jgi:glycerophosphoryl diester phosphodiesterase
MATFNLQGHRGARGLKPENTLPGFEIAFDLGVSSVETDLHVTADGVPVLIHDPILPDGRPVCDLKLKELRCYRADRNPDPVRFPGQDASVTPLAQLFAEQHGVDPYTPPRLGELLAFAAAYAGDLGQAAGKTDAQRGRPIRFDIEPKCVPFRRDVSTAGQLEWQVLDVIRAAGAVRRTTIRCFDHRVLHAMLGLEPGLTGAVIIAETAPVVPPELAKRADARIYAPDFEFLDEAQVRQCHAEGIRVLPWTVNQKEDWLRLLDWGVDGITTDYPDRLAELLRERGIAF